MRLIDADALQAEIDDPTVIRPEGFNILDAAQTIRCGECAECDTCDIHDHAILDVPNFGCAYFQRRQP